MALTHLRYVGDPVVTSLSGTTGTMNLGRCQAVDIQAVLDGNPSYEVALKVSSQATATASKDSCDAVLSNNGTTDPLPLPPGATTKYVAYHVYSGTGVASTSSYDKLVATRLG
jgi:hypothetical protein